MRNETLSGAIIGGWIGSVVSIYTRDIIPTDNFLGIVIKVGFLSLIGGLVIGFVAEKIF